MYIKEKADIKIHRDNKYIWRISVFYQFRLWGHSRLQVCDSKPDVFQEDVWAMLWGLLWCEHIDWDKEGLWADSV